jgi:uncharacterized protein YegP (UPF0339 family)
MSTTAEMYRDRRGEWRWRIRADNWRILAVSSEGYHNKDDCLSGLLASTLPPTQLSELDDTHKKRSTA